ncbi:MAG: N-acetylmuramoyl-L-alanine amidase [Armatimonadota bacterium]
MKPRAIVVHCSASTWGNAAAVRDWHLKRGWDDIGYHAVILNGFRTSNSDYNEVLDGKIEPGRKDNVMGAHCKADDMNGHSLGVCLIGDPGNNGYPTVRQKEALIHYLVTKCRLHKIQVSKITQHSDHDPVKPHCASLDMDAIRKRVKAELLKK